MGTEALEENENLKQVQNASNIHDKHYSAHNNVIIPENRVQNSYVRPSSNSKQPAVIINHRLAGLPIFMYSFCRRESKYNAVGLPQPSRG